MVVTRKRSRAAALPRLTSLPRERWPWLLALAAVVLTSAGVTAAAMLRTSPTFDETVLIAVGARGYHTGSFNLAPDHPPLMKYVYGLPAFLQRPAYPTESLRWVSNTRYAYARQFFWQSGNDPGPLLLWPRAIAVALAAGLVVLTWAFVRRTGRGPLAALLAALVLAFLPDLLAHGGVAYNDIPLALTYLAALWALDAAIRRPTPARGGLAGLLVAVAVGTKFSAVALAPAAALLLCAEVAARPVDRRRAGQLAIAAAVALALMYLGLVAIYRGDWALAQLRSGFALLVKHVNGPGGAPNYFLGRHDSRGFWYFYPVAFFFKTPAALHALMLIAAVGLARGLRRLPAPPLARVRRVAASPLRVPLLGGLAFGAGLLASHLDIGFRYALPVMPLLAILVGAGVAEAWVRSRAWLRAGIVVLLLADVASPLAAYPWFLSYVSEYGPGAGRAHRLFVDSTIDWGQGLFALRDFTRQPGVGRVYLSYFGSAPPLAYGIHYVRLPSYFGLLPDSTPGAPPRYAVISATNVAAPYFRADLFHVGRAMPERVIGGSLYVYRCASDVAHLSPGELDCSRLPRQR